jgi:beta-glucanase (GH16 family)
MTYDDDGRQVMAIAHMTLWVRWAKKGVSDCNAHSAIFHGENKLIFKWDDDEVTFELDQQAYRHM